MFGFVVAKLPWSIRWHSKKLIIPVRDEGKYKNTKEEITKNLLAVCSCDLRFTYILPRPEGSVVDSSVLFDSLTRIDPLIISKGILHLKFSFLFLTSFTRFPKL